jgi:hypothetical protein
MNKSIKLTIVALCATAALAVLPTVSAQAATGWGPVSAGNFSVPDWAPNASNTGVPAGTALTVYEGDMKITTPGTVINAMDIRGNVTVQAANVTIQNTIIRGKQAATGTALIYAGSTAVSNLQVKNTELAPSFPTASMNGIYGSHFTLSRVNIHHVVDSVHIFGGVVTVQDSYLHDNLHYTNDPNWNGGPSHDDSFQIQSGANVNILRNTIYGGFNSVVQVTQAQGLVSNLTFANNFATGGGCTLNIAQNGPNPAAIQGTVLKNNVFGTSRFNCQTIVDKATAPNVTWTNNIRSDRAALKVVLR